MTKHSQLVPASLSSRAYPPACIYSGYEERCQSVARPRVAIGLGVGLCLDSDSDSDSFSDSSGCMSQFVLFLFFSFLCSVVVPPLLSLSLLLLLHVFQIEFTNFWPGLAYCCTANKVFVYSLLISWYIIILAFFFSPAPLTGSLLLQLQSRGLFLLAFLTN